MRKNNYLFRMLLLLLVTASSVLARAASVEYLTLNVGGSPVLIVLAEHPVITYSGNTLHIQTAAETVDVPVSQITGAAFSEEPTAIKGLLASEVLMGEGSVGFSQLPTGSPIAVYAATGVQVLSASADAAGRAAVDLSTLPSGVYIVKSARQTFKITKK